jgi:endoglucanase
MYTLHFSSWTHGSGLRDKANAALNRGLPLFVPEWDATHADGGMDGRVCTA